MERPQLGVAKLRANWQGVLARHTISVQQLISVQQRVIPKGKARCSSGSARILPLGFAGQAVAVGVDDQPPTAMFLFPTSDRLHFFSCLLVASCESFSMAEPVAELDGVVPANLLHRMLGAGAGVFVDTMPVLWFLSVVVGVLRPRTNSPAGIRSMVRPIGVTRQSLPALSRPDSAISGKSSFQLRSAHLAALCVPASGRFTYHWANTSCQFCRTSSLTSSMLPTARQIPELSLAQVHSCHAAARPVR